MKVRARGLQILTFSGKSLVFPRFIAKIEIERERERDGSGADVHTRAREVLADAEAQSESCFGVLLPFRRLHPVLHSRCYARQLRSAEAVVKPHLKPVCSSELSGVEITEAQLIEIKITSAGLWSQNESESNAIDFPNMETVKEKLEGANVDGDGLTFLAAKFWLNWIGSGARRDKLAWEFWKTDHNELLEQQAEPSVSSQSPK